MNTITVSATLQQLDYNELSAEEKKLVDSAKEATFRSYSPYSKFSVGAALKLANGEIVLGCNQENAAYPVTICAERTAIFSAQAQFPDVKIEKLAVAARNIHGEFVGEPVSPCGSCRQAILEQEYRFKQPIRILMVGENYILAADTAKAILPLSFVETDMY